MDTGARFPQMMCKPQAKKKKKNSSVECLSKLPSEALPLQWWVLRRLLFCCATMSSNCCWSSWVLAPGQPSQTTQCTVCYWCSAAYYKFLTAPSLFFLSIVNFNYRLLFWALPSPSDLVFSSSSDSGLLPVGSQQPPVLYIHPALVCVRACSICHGFLCFSEALEPRNGSYFSAP